MRQIVALIALLLLGVTNAPAADAADPVKIRAGWVTTPASLIPILFAKEGVAKHLGQSYVLEPIHFAASTTAITALASGDVDIVPFAYSSFSVAIQNAGLTDLRIIFDETQDGWDGYAANQFIVRKDSGINTIEDLKGKVLATNGIGSGVDMVMKTMLRKHHLEDKRDYTVIEVAFPNMRAVLADHKADLITAALPFVFDPELQKIGRKLFDTTDAVGSTELSFWTTRAGFVEKNRPALIDFLEDALRSLHWYLDPANSKEAIAIVSAYTKQPPELLDGWLFTKKDYFRAPDGMVNLKVLADNIRAQKELGFVKADVDVDKYAALDLVKEAGARLK